MLVKLFGLGDILAAVFIVLLYLDIIRWQTALWVFFFLLIKGFVFRGGLNSFLDKAMAVFVLLMFFGLSWIYGVIGAGLWLLQRGIVSLL